MNPLAPPDLQQAAKPPEQIPTSKLFHFAFKRVQQLLPLSMRRDLQLTTSQVPADNSATLVYTLQAHLCGLNRKTGNAARRSLGTITQANAPQAAFELLCALLHEIESRCDVTTELVDQVMLQLKSAAPSSVTVKTVEDWRSALQENVHLLEMVQLALVDIAGRFVIPAMYQTASHTILLPAHLQATYSNIITVVEDAKLVIKSLGWFRSAVQFLMDGNQLN